MEIRYGAEFENYLQEALGTIEYDGFSGSQPTKCERCDSTMNCIDCEHRNNNQFVSWFQDNGNVVEYPSAVYDSFEELLGFVRNIMNKYLKSDNLILHSFPDHCASAGFHVHISPQDYDYYKTLYKLTYVYQILFKNSPYNNGSKQIISKRHYESGYAPLSSCSKESYSSGRAALCKNGVGDGTIEFRYMDFPKSLNQLAFLFYLDQISRSLLTKDTKKNQSFLSSKKFENCTIGKIGKINCMQQIEDGSNYIELIKEISKMIQDTVNPIVYSFYEETYMSFEQFVNNTIAYDRSILKRFFSANWSDIDWSDFWKADFVKKIPTKLIKKID